MPKTLPTPDRLFDRTWRPGHPFRPRVSRTRRLMMALVFGTLCVLIGAHQYLTDSNRVRRMAEDDLSKLLGGQVRVDRAYLSIFEGLRLDGVKLYVGDPKLPDSLLFSAQSFLIEYNPIRLLARKIEATRIVAVEPRVLLTEDTDTGKRNFSTLLESRQSSPMAASGPTNPLVLPEISLRNAQVEYIRLKNKVPFETSSIAIDGLLRPEPESNVYSFAFQSRGKSTEIGPMIQGRMMASGEVRASLQNFEFGPDLKAMLPLDVRRWSEEHGLTGRLNIPVLIYTPAKTLGGDPGYRVEIGLEGGKLTVHPSEWMGDDETRMLDGTHRAFDALRMSGLNGHGFVDQVAQLVEPTPIQLRDVRGRFTFTDDQSIQIEDLNGWLEELWFKIEGTIKGYTPAAAAKLRIASSELHDVEIPAAPRYLNSLPPAVREIYDDFKPRGRCRFWVDLDRPNPGQRPYITGRIDIIDGNFTFVKFPYPMQKTTGGIILSLNPRTKEESIQLDRIRGHGVEGGPNANSDVEINGTIGPFGPQSYCDIIVSGMNITSEPAVIAAFPPMTRKALTLFDAPGKGEFPRFGGNFSCSIKRIPGHGREGIWSVVTNIQLENASGALVGFPYPMSGVNGDLRVYDDHVELVNVAMNKLDASMRIDGNVYWPHGGNDAQPNKDAPPANDAPSLRPNLKIVARNVPIDGDLLSALAPQRRAWLEKIGAGGRFDLEGTIKSDSSGSGGSAYDLRIALHDGTLWPIDGKPAATNVEGNLTLTNQRLAIGELRGRRGPTELLARGEISWPNDSPGVVLQAEARDLLLDSSLYRLLPESGRSAWDQVRPEGTVDVSFNYSGAVTTASPTTEPSTQPASPGDAYEVVITPRKLSATPTAVPYRLEELAGSARLTPDRVELKDLTARHGDARVRFSGTGGTGESRWWDFNLAGENVSLDDDLRHALPQSLADLFKSLDLKGKFGFEFSKLHLTLPQQGSSTTRPAAITAAPDVDFQTTLKTDSASLDVGVPLTDVKGAINMTGSSRGGKLSTLGGDIKLDSLTLAGRSVTDLRGKMRKNAEDQTLTIGNMEANVARGNMTGAVAYEFPDNRASRYAVNLILRDADVRDLAGETSDEIQGRVSASLALEGTYDQPNSRRGRGDVSVVGQKMYKIPLVLGLLQITNLSLPITSPFTQASARYSMDGRKVTFEQIELRSKEMLMQGDGNLDFGTKQVKMNFVTDSTTWPKLPLIGDVIEQARHELLQIHVRGTLEEPKVSARAMNTLTTTVDEVFKGDERQQPPTTQKK